MAKQLNVSMSFTADTRQAQQQLQQLQSQLDSLISGYKVKGLNLGIDDELHRGITAAAELKAKLLEATNVNTGKLDLTKFSNSLGKGTKQLNQYAQELSALGPAGTEAFMQIARAISNAETPLISVSSKLKEFGTTLKNTARWQISSSILHGFMGAIQSAYGYAQDLNESLNNIRIVTGYNTDKMADFAQEANKAAKALSTTTTQYTNASLIYYQQGLSDSEVIDRTETTIKLANVARESAETVSDQMTAVWNNFYDGSKSIEYYADVLTALGAATASSTAEISEGLEKFASIANTVGLSYEYATAALATVTATTRQSADIVGTAFKTLFARIQDLELGETLDDGVTLGTYSQALETIGVDILDATGNVKEMDNILTEMAGKWDSLSEAQKISTAQTVAGVRQYTQLIALMDNWDFMEQNVATASGAEGTLQEQADIYAESWEAAQDRVKAALETLYDDLIDDEFFINILNSCEDILTFIDKAIDSLGGLKGVLLTISTIVFKVFGDQIAANMTSMANSIKAMTPKGHAEVQHRKDEAWDAAANMSANNGTQAGAVRADSIKQEAELQKTLLANNEHMSEQERTIFQIRMDSVRALQQTAEQQAAELDTLNQETEALELQEKLKMRVKNPNGQKNTEQEKKINTFSNASRDYGKFSAAANKTTKVLDKQGSTVGDLKKTFKGLTATFGENNKTLNKMRGKFAGLDDDVKLTDKQMNSVRSTLEKLDNQAFKPLAKSTQALADNNGNLTKEQEALGHSAAKAGAAELELEIDTANVDHEVKELNEDMKNAHGSITNWSSVIVSVVGSLSQITMGLNALVTGFQSLSTALDDGNLSFSELLSFLMSIGTAIPMLISGFTSLATTEIAMSTATGVDTTMTLADWVAHKLLHKEIDAINHSNLILLAVMVAIAAIIAVVTLAIKGLTAWYNKDANAAKKCAEEAETAATAFEDAKNKYDELKDTINDYEEALNSINTLTKGTEEFDKAVETANEKVLELLQNYGNIDLGEGKTFAEYVTTDENGVLQVGNLANGVSALDALEQYGMSNVDKAQRNSYMATVRKNNADSKSEITDTARSITYSDYEGGYNTASNASVNKVLEVLETSGSGIFKDLDTFAAAMGMQVSDPLCQALYNNKDALLELNSTVSANNKTNSILNQQIADSWLSSTSSEYQNAGDNQDEVASVIGKALDDVDDSKWKKNYEGKNDKEIQEEYANLMGWDVTNIKNKGDGTGIYSLSDGTTYTVDDETARYALNQAKYLEDIGSDSNVQEILDSLDAVSGKAKGASQDVQDLLKDFASGQITSFDNQSKETLEELKAMAEAGLLTDAQAQALGYDSAIAFTEALDTAIAEADSYKSIRTKVENDGVEFTTAMQEWYDSLPQEDKEFATKVTFDEGDTEAEWNEKLAEIREKAQLEEVYTTAKNEGFDEDVLKTHAELLARDTESLKDNKVAAAKAALQSMRLNAGITKLNEAYNDNITVLKTANKTSLEYAEAITEMQDALETTFGVRPSVEFIEKNLDKISKLATGDTSVLEDLRTEITKDYIATLEIETSLDEETCNKTVEEARSFLIDLADWLGNQQLTVGENITLSDNYMETLQQMLDSGMITEQQLETMFSSAGYSFKVNGYKEVNGPKKTVITSVWDYDANTGKQTNQKTTKTETQEVIQVPIVNGNDSAVTSTNAPATITKLAGASTVNTVSNKDTTSGSKKDKKKADDEIERYHKIKEAIEDIETETDRLKKKQDRLYGGSVIKNLNEQISKNKELLALKEQYLSDAQNYQSADLADLTSKAAAYGVTVETDAAGRLQNYEEILTAALNSYNNTLTDAAETQYEELKDALSQYEETLNLTESLQDEITDLQNTIQDENYEKITTTLELKLEIDEDQLDMIEWKLSMISDDFYKIGEAINLVTSEYDELTGMLNSYKSAQVDLETSYKNGDISQADYVEGLKTVRDGYKDTIDSLQELDDTMKEYYGNTLEQAEDILASYTDRMDDLSTTLEHYQTILELTGRTDFATQKNLAETQKKLAANSYAVKKANYEMLLSQEATVTANWNKVKNNTSDVNYDFYKQQYDDLQNALSDAQNEMYESAEEWAESMKELFSVTMAEAADDMEKSLSGGLGFDALNETISTLRSSTDEYLTKTNQLYETNKLMRDVNQAINKTDNVAAKQKLKAFNDEIEALQEKDELSNLELEIAQAKYKVLQAQIALEEAQNAKSTVRLTRDDEGNYGYVYTANQDAVSDAEQELADAENDLYNIRLDATNEYGEKKLQAEQDYINKMLELDEAFYTDQSITEAEYKAQSEALLNAYYQQIETFSKLYGIAQEEDAAVVKEAWAGKENGTYAALTSSADDWKTKVTEYKSQVQQAWTDYKTEIDTNITPIVGEDFDELKDKTKDLTDESDSLKKEIVNQVVPALKTQLVNALDKTTTYAETNRKKIYALKQEYYNLTQEINDTITALNNLATAQGGTTTTKTPTTTSNPTTATDGDGSGDGDKDDPVVDQDPEPATPTLRYVSISTTKVRTQSEFARNKNLVNTYGTYRNYLQNYAKSNALISSESEFNRSKDSYPESTYQEYLNNIRYKVDGKEFRTGGYTGEWGPEGRLAILHEKELVLNQEDTNNILASVQIIRQLSDMLDRNAEWASTGLGSLTASGTAGINDILEQNVTITAEFPNATNHSEIEEAFNSLINQASQYANRY